MIKSYKTHFRKLMMVPNNVVVEGAPEPTSQRQIQALEIFLDQLNDLATDYAAEMGLEQSFDNDNENEAYKITPEEARNIRIDRFRAMFFEALKDFGKLTNCDPRDVPMAFGYDHQSLYNSYAKDMPDVNDMENICMLSEMCLETDAYIRARLAGERYIDTRISTHLGRINAQNPYPSIYKTKGIKPPEHG